MAVTVAELRNIVTLDMSGLQAGATKSQSVMNNLSQSMTKVGTALTIGVTAPLLLIAKTALSAGSSFESAFAGVRKTVDATESELAKMRDGFRKLALEIPISANEMARIGEAAGALGVKSKDILTFTRVMADLGVATNLTSDQAATGLSRLAYVMANEAGPQYDRLGATLVALGNAGASTESEILEMSLRIAGAGKLAGLSEAEIMGFANALSSVGIEAEAGGSSISRVFTKIDDAAKLGGSSLKVFAQTAGQSVAEFKRAIETDAAGATISFIEGLNRIAESGKSLTPILKELELGDIRVSDALRRAAGAGDLFRESIELGSKAWADNTALTKEAAERYKTFESQVQLVKNQLSDIAINIFDKLRPALMGMLESVKGAIRGFADLDEGTIKAGVTFLAVAGSAGPIALLAGSLLALGPQGAVVAAVVAGSAAIAAAYVTDFATVNRTISSHVALFSKGTGEMSGSWSSLTDKIEIGTLALVTGFERIVVAMERIAVNAVTAGKIMLASLSGNWGGIITAWNEGRAKLEAIDATWESNVQARVARIKQIEGEQAWRELWARTATVNREGALASVKAWDDVFNKQSPATSLMDALNKHKGPTVAAARAMGQAAGQEFLGAWRQGIEQKSPSGFEKDLDRIEKAFADFPGKIVKHISGLSAAGKLLLKEFRDAAKGIVDDLNKHIREIEIDKLIRDRVAPAVKILTDAAKASLEVIVPLNQWYGALMDNFIRLAPAANKAGVAFDGAKEAIRDFAAAGVAKLAAEFAALSDHFQDLSRSLPQAWNTIIDGIVKGSGHAGSALLNLGVKIKGYALDVINVFDALPGKWGQSLNQALNEVNRWITFIDAAIKLIQRIMDDAQTGLSGVFEKIAGVFKKHTATVKVASEDWAGSLEKISKGSKDTEEKTVNAFSLMSSAIAGFASGVAIAAATSSKAIGVIGGAAMGAFQGFMMAGPVGAIVGGIAGLFGGLFGGGKSAAQKEAERQAAERVKLDAQQTGQTIINTYMDGIAKALDLAPRIAEFENVSKAQIRLVFKFMSRIVNNFLESAKQWTSENLKKGKEVAEAIGPVFQIMTAIPEAEAAINRSFGVSDAQIDLAFNSLDKIFNRWAVRAEEWIGSRSKQIKKVAERLAPAINLISPLIQAITDTSKVTEPTDAQLGIVDRSLDKIITMVGNLAEKFEKPFLKALQSLSEKVQPAVVLWKDFVELLRATLDVPGLKERDADNVVGGMRLFIDKLIAGFSSFQTEGLGRLVAIVQAIIPVAGALKAWADSSAAVRGYTAIAAESWDAIVADFTRAITLMGILIGQAQQFEAMAITLEGILKSGAQHLNDGISAMTAGVVGAAGALQDAFGHIQGGTVGATSAGGFAPMSSQSFKSASSQSVTVNIGDVFLDGRRAPEQKQSLAAMVAELISSQSGQAQANRNNQPGVMDLVNFAKRTKFAY